MQMKIFTRPLLAAVCVAAVTLAGCHSQASSSTASSASSSSAAMSASAISAGHFTQQQFDTPEAAAAALKQAIDLKDRNTLLALLGPEGHQIIFSGDPVQESNRLDSFAKHMGEQLRVDHPDGDKAVLYIGAENWPMPIPLAKSGSQWHFDTQAGKEEILNRRIGQNEFGAIDVCREFVRAEKEYAEKPRTDDRVVQYARVFGSTPGKHDGLYWEPASPSDFSPMGTLLASAEAEGYGSTPVEHRAPYHGYRFHILTAQGADAQGGAMDYVVDGRLIKGFALIAYPAEWGNSGAMTFMVNQDGKVFQKNLGEDTSRLARQIKEYNPDSSWTEVKE